MTCIVAVQDSVTGAVVVGGDSAGVAGLSIETRADTKVFINEPYLIGFSGSFRDGQLLRYAFKPPRPNSHVDLDKFMTTRFMTAVRKCLKANGSLITKDGVDSWESSVIVVVGGHIYAVHSDFQIGRVRQPFYAVGCGADIALGALFVAKSLYGSSEAGPVAVAALEAASTFSAGVTPPFNLVQWEPPRNSVGPVF